MTGTQVCYCGSTVTGRDTRQSYIQTAIPSQDISTLLQAYTRSEN